MENREPAARAASLNWVAARRLNCQTKPGDCPPLRLVLQPSGDYVIVRAAEAIVGRHSEADIHLPLPDVSRRHCRFAYRDGQWEIVDLDSTNGICVNTRATHQAVLRHGDTVGIGGYLFSVDLQVASEPPAASAGPPDGTDERMRAILSTIPHPVSGLEQRRAS